MDTPATPRNAPTTAADLTDLPRTTGDLPPGFRFEPVTPAVLAAIMSSGLQIVGCIHGTACSACVAAAARKVVEAAG